MKRFWTAQQVAEFLGFSVRKVREDDANGRIPAARQFGRLKRWDSEELARWSDAGCPPRLQWERMKSADPARATVSATA